MKLNDKKTIASLSFAGNVTAPQLEDLIGQLMELRAHMLPAVPTTQPTADSDANVIQQDDPYFTVAFCSNGDFRFWLRNQGLGWIAFEIPKQKVAGLRDYLVAKAPETQASINLVSDEVGSGSAH